MVRRKRFRGEVVVEQVCQACGTSSHDAANYRDARTFKVNYSVDAPPEARCGHMFCDLCVHKNLNASRKRFVCPVCGAEIRMMTLHTESVAQLDARRDREVRSRVAGVFNKEREDFESERAFNDFLEQAEDVVYKLVNGIDREQVEAFLRDYARQHESEIAKNDSRRADRRSKLQTAIEREAQLDQEQRLAANEDERKLELALVRNKEKMVRRALEGALGDGDEENASDLASIETALPMSVNLAQPQPLFDAAREGGSRNRGFHYVSMLDPQARDRLRRAGGASADALLARSWGEALAGF